MLAISVSAVMLICSINIRKLNARFWSIFLCASIVCSLAFYGVHKSVFDRKTAPVIDYSGITPEINEEKEDADAFDSEKENNEDIEETSHENEPIETENTTVSNSEADQVAQGEIYNQSETQSQPAGDASPGNATEEESLSEPLTEEEISQDVPAIAPEIEYEGPFRTE